MKTKLPWTLTILLAIALLAVLAPRPSAHAPHAAQPQKRVRYWVDPMHPAYRSDKPGKAPDCGMELVPVYADDAPPSEVPGYAAIKMPPERQQQIGVRTDVVQLREVGHSIRTVGRIAVDETRQVKVATKFDGYIETLYVNTTGQPVRRGQPLFSIYSPDLLATQQEYLLALRAAKQSPELLDAARQRLRLWDVTPAEIATLERSGTPRKSLTIASPASGVVLTKSAVEGARVTAGEPLFEIASLDRVWLQADVYESELPFVRVGAPATMTLTYIPGRTWSGRVTFIAPTVDPMTRTIKVRIEFDNRDAALKPDMFADVVIAQPARQVIAVPESAVLQTGTRALVFVVDAAGTIAPREVTLGAKRDGFAEVHGVAVGERVVSEANFLVDSESRLRASLSSEGRGQKAEVGATHEH